MIPPEASFRQHSYFEWHYANGQTMLAVSKLGDASGEGCYADHVRAYCDTTLSTAEYFRWQYDVLKERSGFNYRIFRKGMLDNTTAPALPFVESLLKGALPNARPLVDEMADYITRTQLRLKDGTLCRPDPDVRTVWADDLFMGVPFLLRYARLSGRDDYYDDAARQIVNFHRYLFDAKTGLSFHSWYDGQKKNSPVRWGRANGWMIWAISEALIHLPRSHRDYEAVLKIFRRHVEGLVRYQNANGMWHQVLDHPESYEETSCTAMFIIAMARGVRYEWIDTSYAPRAMRAWEAVARTIDRNGTVSGICQGTGIGNDLAFYFKRRTPPHDPRGLGAVITAGIEMQSLLDARIQRRLH